MDARNGIETKPQHVAWHSARARGSIWRLILTILLLEATAMTRIEAKNFDPPWEGEDPSSPRKGVIFTAPDVDNMPDFHGNPVEARFVIFAGGNYFFALGELIAAFENEQPGLKGKVFYETIPPGVVAKQLQSGNAITVGNLTLSVRPDVVQAGREQVEELIARNLLEGPPVSFIENRLAIMVKDGNPRHIESLNDLARPGLRLALPNPETEGIAKKIRIALQQAGGERLAHEVLENKIQGGEALWTQIHHRQTPLWILKGQVDAGVTWLSEVVFQQKIGHPIGLISIAPEYNQDGIEAAALVRRARHSETAKAWLRFLRSDIARRIIESYGMAAPR
ncbi:ABC transporter substrate-binding protein [Candidatus Methylobacter favarea]|uniref:ABC transporter substrate-binding protein n=1 Tax=Candidatus Methylobacter favarea TaxID=2707345 RepID=A0A8S0Y9I1_9GAMM|nr:substrate-binding domain-containing protein [Candidatus Methylobacter favarea]CAA9890178.1 ABC transporter substrate-binding protein [Candidatus Methylobacter favarea]